MAAFYLTDRTKTIEYKGQEITLHQIKSKAKTVVGNPDHYETYTYGIRAGETGGWVEALSNLSQNGHCWVGQNAMVFGGARVSGNAVVHGNAIVCDNAQISGDSQVCGDAIVGGSTIFRHAEYMHDGATH